MQHAKLPRLYIVFCLFLIASASVVQAQTTIQRAPTPVTGHYPGGHVGLRGGDSPEAGDTVSNFNKIHFAGELKGARGETIKKLDTTSFANITPVVWTTNWKILGMRYGGLAAFPVNDIYNRPSGQSVGTSSSYGFGDVVVIPFALYGETKSWDFQVATGPWMPTGKFNAGNPDNHGAGFWEMVYSTGFTYYPKGNRRDWSISAVARFEQNFTQRDTKIGVGDDVVIDYAVGKVFIVGNTFKHAFDVGISGFTATQLTHETGVNRALNTSLYRVFGSGPDFRYIIPKWKLSFTLRPQWEYGARNTSQGMTLWLAMGYKFH